MTTRLFDPEHLETRRGLFAEGDPAPGAGGAPPAADGAPAASAPPAPSADPPPAGPPSSDWRAPITDAEAKKFAESSPDLAHLVGRAVDMRKKLSSAVFIPGKDAKPEEISAYRKAMKVPEKAEEYLAAFPQPEKGQQLSEAEVATRTKWAERFHASNIPADVAAGLVKAFGEEAAAEMKAMQEADAAYAKQAEEALKKEWPGDEYQKNKTYAERAAAKVFGDNLDEVRKLEDKTGRFILDNPLMVRAMAVIGREMGEDRIGSVLSDGERNSLNDQIDGLQAKIDKATAEGRSSDANDLYQKKLALIGKRDGDKPIVGRAA